MILSDLSSNKFTTEKGVRVTVQVPDHYAQQIVDAVLTEQQLKWGDYDSVAFRSAPGV